MSKSIDKLSITQLIELKTASDFLANMYAEDLTAYVPIGTSIIDHFNNLPKELQDKYEKRMKLKNLSDKITQQIEKNLEEYYE